MALEAPNMMQILAADPGAEIQAQEAARRRQAMAQLLQQNQQMAAEAGEYKDLGGGGGGGSSRSDVLAGLLGNPVASPDGGAPEFGPPPSDGPAPVTKYDFGKNVKGDVSISDVAKMALKNGATPEQAATLAAISRPESGGNSHAFNGKGKDLSHGLLQINMLGGMGPERRARYGLTSNEQLFDPETNIRVGLDLAKRRGNFNDWSTYLNGSYKRYMPEALEAVKALGPQSNAADVAPQQVASLSQANDASPRQLPPTMANAQPAPENNVPLPPQRPPQAQLNQLAAGLRQQPQQDDNPISAIGNAIGGMFDGGQEAPQEAPQQVAGNGAAGWGQGGYRERKNYGGSGLLGLAQNAIGNLVDQGEAPQATPEVQQMLNDPRKSVQYAVRALDTTQSPQQRQIFQYMSHLEAAREKQIDDDRRAAAASQPHPWSQDPNGAQGQYDEHGMFHPAQREEVPTSIKEYEYYKKNVREGEMPRSFEDWKKAGGNNGVNHRHVIGGALVDDDGKVIYQKPEEEGWSSDAIEDAAIAENAGDKSWKQNVGRGVQGGKILGQVQNRAAERRREANQSVADIMQNAAEYGGVKARERTLGQQEGNAVTSAIEAGNALTITRKATDALGNGNLPDINMAINAFKNHTGEPQVQAFGQSAATLANTYARAVNPKGLPHESVLRDTIERMSAARSPQQLHAIMDVMQQEIEMAVNAPRQARETIKGMDKGEAYKVPEYKGNGGTTSNGLKWSVE